MTMDFEQIKLGILGGGQLGKMLCLVASNWNLSTYVLDPSSDCPAASVCTGFSHGDFRNYEDVYAFGKNVDILTIEIEHVNLQALFRLQEEGVVIRPEPHALELIQDKAKQKRFYTSKGLPTADFSVFPGKEAIVAAVESGEIRIPFVQKLSKTGYDGRGVYVVREKEQLSDLLAGESVVEDLVDVEKEISVIVSRNSAGEMKCFPPVEMVFNSHANIVEFLISPCELDDALFVRACELAEHTIKSFDMCGILAVEMFLSKKGDILINESAPRPHNSGHHTIDAARTSQYEQCLRSILDLPPGDTEIKTPSVMINILGQPGFEGQVRYEGLRGCMSVEGAKFHIYGKTWTKPYRKMGHVTVLDDDISSALEKAKFIMNNLRAVA